MAAKKKVARAAKATHKKKSKALAKQAVLPRPRPAAQPRLEPARLQAELRESIERDIAARVARHQREVASLRSSLRAGAKPPLMLLAHGDSWFNYPLKGNTVTLPVKDTDIIAQLGKMGTLQPKILNLSHFGDATTDEMGLAKQQRLIEALSNTKNWLTGKPDAILFSGGGNDIAGDPFCIYLDYKASSSSGLDSERFAGRLDSIRASYLDLFLFRSRYAPNVPILGHCYDFGRPMQKPHPPCMGPWLWPSLQFTGWSDDEGAQILHDALIAFKDMLGKLESDPRKFDFTVLPTQGTLAREDWANELHPYPPGFVKLAQKFLAALQVRFPGRI